MGLDAEAPYNGSVYDLATMTCLAEGYRTQLEKKKTYPAKINPVFERLYQAGRRLLHIIEQSRGLANRELGKFADEVAALCSKWEK